MKPDYRKEIEAVLRDHAIARDECLTETCNCVNALLSLVLIYGQEVKKETAQQLGMKL